MPLHRVKAFLLAIVGLSCVLPAVAQNGAVMSSGQLGDNKIISSRVLGYDLAFRVYTPPGYEKLDDLPVVYVTDGQWYISEGRMPALMNRMIAAGEIAPVMAVFIDNRNPYNMAENRRNDQFWCNEKYAQFFDQELVPTIDARFKTRSDRSSRVILGLSFGGLNAACFGLQAHETFQGIAMQSPAMHPVPSLFSDYEAAPKRTLKFFLSTGTRRDNAEATRRLKAILEAKAYEVQYEEVPFGHDWANWGPLLDDVLSFFFGARVKD